MAKQSNLNAPAIKAWLAKGAQPTDTVGQLLKKSLIIE
jgi:small subunit ribosomal protein S16